MAETNEMLAPPAVTHLRVEVSRAMERTLSSDIREEREDLREAAEQTLNVIMDLGLDGTIRWASPSWVDVIGTEFSAVKGKMISDLVTGDNKDVFADALESMKKDSSRSHIIRFTVQLGPASKLAPLRSTEQAEEDQEQDANSQPEEPETVTIDLEGQGIMVYDRASEKESHVSLHTGPNTTTSNSVIDNVDDPALDCTTRDPD